MKNTQDCKSMIVSATKIRCEARRWLQGVCRYEFLHSDAQGVEGIRAVGAGLELVFLRLGQLLASLVLLVVVDGGCCD